MSERREIDEIQQTVSKYTEIFDKERNELRQRLAKLEAAARTVYDSHRILHNTEDDRTYVAVLPALMERLRKALEGDDE